MTKGTLLQFPGKKKIDAPAAVVPPKKLVAPTTPHLPKSPGNEFWIDMEMTGEWKLGGVQSRVLEIAAVATSANRKIRAVGPHIVVHQEESVLLNMDDWNRDHHIPSGLRDESLKSTIRESDAEEILLPWLKEYTEKGVLLCGISVHNDLRFIEAYMPNVYRWIGHATYDVGSITGAFKQFNPRIYKARPKIKGVEHRAQPDVFHAIELDEYYCSYIAQIEG